MKKESNLMKKGIAVLAVMAMTVALCACGSSEKKDSKGAGKDSKPAYDVQTVTYKENFKVEIVGDEVIYNEEDGSDNLIVDIKVTNIGKEAKTFTTVANITTKQGEESLGWSQLRDKDDNFVATLNSDEEIQPGKSTTLKGGWIINDPEADVVIEFNGWAMESGAGNVTLKVAGRETKEHQSYVVEQESILAAKKEAKEADITAAVVKIPEGAYFDEFDEDSAKVMVKEGESAYVEVEYSTLWGTAKEWADSMNGNFGGDNKITEKKIGDITYQYMEINDSQYMLFVDSGEGAVRVYGMFVNLEDSMDIVKGISLK
ncbi:MAG: DUF5067 domain-containing protein [Eubacterium sp.]|nr:DUF5067 domain-containing protein [Eubacterium sp.]